MDSKKKTLILALVVGIVSFFYFDLGQYLSLDFVKSQQDAISQYHQDNPLTTALIFVVIYVAVTALSLPGAAVMTLVGGAIFGLIEGTIWVSIASTTGATLAFLVSRTLLRESVENKFGDSLKSINAGIEKEGAFYLFGLRLVPLFPFFVINLVMGLTSIRTVQFFFVSQLGMLPGTLVFVYAGTQLGQIDSLSGILSPGLLFAFALLGIFPILAKKFMESLQAKKVYKNYEKPKSFDTNMVVIGAGSAGLVTSLIAAATKAKVSLIERHKMGGDCLNTGCVPSKALIRSAKMAKYYERADEFGLSTENIEVNFPAVMERIQSVIKTIEPHDSVERFTGLGVDCVQGSAEILDPFRVKVNDQIITTKNIVISTGARPFVPPIKGIENTGYLTSDTVWELREKPKNMLVIGGGPIGCEMAQSFQRLGVQVIQVDRSDRIMPREDADVSAVVQERFIAEGIDLRLGYQAQEFIVEKRDDTEQKILICQNAAGEEQRIEFDVLLLAVGRKPNVEGFGLDKLDIPLTDKGTIEVNEYLQTKYPNILACGDVAGPYQFTHTASHQAWYTAVNGLFGVFKKFKADYRVIPWATFTDPEVARVGLNEQEAKAQGIAYEATTYGIDDLDRAIADGEAHGFIKVLTVPGKDKILGATIVGHHAGDIIAEYVTAMKHGLGLNKILGTIHIYPTLAETNKFVAGNWKRANAPEKVLAWLEKFHAWRRGA